MSWIARAFLLPFSLLLYLGAALIVSASIDLAITHLQPSQSDFQNCETRIRDESELFKRTFDTSYRLLDARRYADSLTNSIHKTLAGERVFKAIDFAQTTSLQTWLRDQLKSLVYTLEVFTMRVVSLIAILPVLLLASVIWGVDGFVRRAVRKASAGLESARLYHFAKRTVKPLMVWSCLVYLVIPIPADVVWLNAWLVCTVPVLLGITVSRFKKYV